MSTNLIVLMMGLPEFDDYYKHCMASNTLLVFILVAFLKSYGMSPLNVDLSVYVEPRLMIAIFVDDLLITGSSTSEIKAAKAAFQAGFRMSDLGPCKFYLGMTVTQGCENKSYG